MTPVPATVSSRSRCFPRYICPRVCAPPLRGVPLLLHCPRGRRTVGRCLSEGLGTIDGEEADASDEGEPTSGGSSLVEQE